MDEEDGRLGPTARQFGRFDVLTDAWMMSLCRWTHLKRQVSELRRGAAGVSKHFRDFSMRAILSPLRGWVDQRQFGFIHVRGDSSGGDSEWQSGSGTSAGIRLWATQNDSAWGEFRPETVQIQMKRGR